LPLERELSRRAARDESPIVNFRTEESIMKMRLQNWKFVLRALASNRGVSALAAFTMAVGLMVVPAYAGPKGAAENSVAAGRWEGNVQIPGSGLRVVFDLAQDSDGKWIGSAIVPGFGVKGIALSDLEVNGSEVSFAIKGTLGAPKIKGHIDAKNKFTGDFEEAGNTAPFVLGKAGPPQVEPQVKSTPVSKELEGEWQGDFVLPGRTLRVTVNLTNHDAGPASAKFHLKGKNDYDIPVDFVTQDGDLLTLESPAAHFIYQGFIQKDTGEIKGELELGPYDEPLVIHPAAKNAAESK
jgi:hypothetical protein